jgi:hypothetical protein
MFDLFSFNEEVERSLGLLFQAAYEGNLSLIDLEDQGDALINKAYEVIDLEKFSDIGENSLLHEAERFLDNLHEDFTRDFYRENPQELKRWANRLLRM